MLKGKLLQGRRAPDALGLMLGLAVVGFVSATCYLALDRGWFRSPWELAALVFASVAFLGTGIGVHQRRTGDPPSVYGSAKVASEQEAQAAARGENASSTIHDRTFRD
jgi:hypothetical protein